MRWKIEGFNGTQKFFEWAGRAPKVRLNPATVAGSLWDAPP